MRLAWCSASVSMLVACSAIVDPDPARLGGGSDAGAPDARVITPDSGSPDAGPRDAGPRDAGPPCTGPSRCEGEILVSCREGVTLREPCTDRASYCGVDRCQGWVCAPGERACTASLRGLVVCSSRGDAETTTPCELGCNSTTRTCTTISPTCTGTPRIDVGQSSTFDLCRETNDDTHVPATGCSSTGEADVGDRTFLLVLDVERAVTIELTDVDTGAAIDTLVYVRRACDDPGSQVACDDDVPCGESTVPGTAGCSGELDVRQSRLTIRLGAGAYYIVADAFAYSTERATYRCGSVRLSVREAERP